MTIEINQIRKRNGAIVPFQQYKIENAILRALKATGVDGNAEGIASNLAAEVVIVLKNQLAPNQIPSVEAIQDIVERVLMKNGYLNTAKSYILYRDEHRRLREQKNVIEGLNKEIRNMVESYTKKQDDLTVRENSNGIFSMSGLQLHISGEIIKSFCLNNMYDSKISEAHKKGYIHIHDLPMGLVGYCAGWSLEKLLKNGLGGVPGKFTSKPAKHFDAATLHIANFIGTLQQEWAGAQAFSSVDTLLAPFIKVENLGYKEVKQILQKLIFNLNQNERWGSQTPFSNFTFDLKVPADYANRKVIIGGKEIENLTYGECQKEMDLFNRAFLELLAEGDANGRPPTFPIPTYNITKDFEWDSDIVSLLFEVTSKYGLPYFQNYIGTGRNPGEIRAMCCRLQMDLEELINRPGSLWGPGESTGSIGVVTINMNRLGYEAAMKGGSFEEKEKSFFESLSYYMDLAKNSLEIKRKVVNQNMENGLMPYTKVYLGHFNNHFSTIGLVGMNEACLNLIGENISSPKSKDFTIKTLLFMREKIKKYQEETGNLYNLEASPAESTAYRLALKDKEMYPNIITAGVDVPYLTNSTHLPVNHGMDLFDALQHQNDIQALYTGGTIFHVFIGEQINPESCKNLVRKIAEKTKIPYFSITPTFSVCLNHGYLPGIHYSCPHCNSKTETWSRVTGYYRPVQNWNLGKQEEFKERTLFKIGSNNKKE